MIDRSCRMQVLEIHWSSQIKQWEERGGIDAFNAAEANDLAKIELGKKWKDLSYATDFVKTDF